LRGWKEGSLIKSYIEGPESELFLEEPPTDSRPLLEMERERRPIDCLSRPRLFTEDPGRPGLLVLIEDPGRLGLVLGREDPRFDGLCLETDWGRPISDESRESNTGRTFLCSAGFRRDAPFSMLEVLRVPWLMQFLKTPSADALISDFDEPKHRTIAEDI
jgi:hypothetical protein